MSAQFWIDRAGVGYQFTISSGGNISRSTGWRLTRRWAKRAARRRIRLLGSLPEPTPDGESSGDRGSH